MNSGMLPEECLGASYVIVAYNNVRKAMESCDVNCPGWENALELCTERNKIGVTSHKQYSRGSAEAILALTR